MQTHLKRNSGTERTDLVRINSKRKIIHRYNGKTYIKDIKREKIDTENR